MPATGILSWIVYWTIIVFYMATKQVKNRLKQERQEIKPLHSMFAAILLIQIISCFLHLLKAGGLAGMLRHMVTMVSCAGLTMHGRKIHCVMHVMARGLQVIAFLYIPAVIVASVLKN